MVPGSFQIDFFTNFHAFWVLFLHPFWHAFTLVRTSGFSVFATIPFENSFVTGATASILTHFFMSPQLHFKSRFFIIYFLKCVMQFGAPFGVIFQAFRMIFRAIGVKAAPWESGCGPLRRARKSHEQTNIRKSIQNNGSKINRKYHPKCSKNEAQIAPESLKKSIKN